MICGICVCDKLHLSFYFICFKLIQAISIYTGLEIELEELPAKNSVMSSLFSDIGMENV